MSAINFYLTFYLIHFAYGYFDDFNRNLKRHKRENSTDSMCQIPYSPSNTTYVILRESSNNYKSGDSVQQYNVLQTKCDDGYNLAPFSSNVSICINGAWNPLPSICFRACPSLNSTQSTGVKCKYHDIPLEDCKNPIEGTKVILQCAPLYEEASIHENPAHLCRKGRWDPVFPSCRSVCGLKRPRARTNIINGSDTVQGDYPWHVGIFNNKKELLCGGSIIDQRIILTAAHCIADHYGNIEAVGNYLIGAGKFYRKYDDERDEYAQYSSILEIHAPERYKGISHFYSNDIAIAILANPLTLSLSVQPVCIELGDESQYLDLSRNNIGTVIGWGYTSEGVNLSERLKEIQVPYVSYQKCYEEVPETFRQFITYDKICAGYKNNGTSVCGGDSGGGLYFKKLNNGRYYQKGIVSISPATLEFSCDSNQYSTYTFLDKHVDFLRDLLAYHQTYHSVESPQDDLVGEEVEIELPVGTCSLPKELGPCRNFSVEYFYDMNHGRCSRFWYGGCGGNNNRFQSAEKCKAACVEPIRTKSRCLLPKVVGPCSEHFLKWYYNPEIQACSQFVYGGCLGNNNKFETMDECEKLCKTTHIILST